MVVDGSTRWTVIGRHAPWATCLSYVKYRVKDIEEVLFSRQSHVMGQRRPDNQFLFIGQIGLIFQQVLGYMVDMDSYSMGVDGFSLCWLFICRSVKKCNPLMWPTQEKKVTFVSQQHAIFLLLSQSHSPLCS